MADVRSMLRAERANRRIAHPNASYTTDGKLLCNLCQVLVRSEAAWTGHLHSTQHTLRSSRAQDAASIRPDNGSKKRKAESSDAPRSPEGKKRVKGAAVPFRSTKEEVLVSEDGPLEREPDPLPDVLVTAQPVVPTDGAIVDATKARPEGEDDELAAFERELAALEQTSDPPINALHAAATIAAAPMSAADIAAQAREEQSAQRGKRDEEIAAEKEDAATALEEEFEEMQALEERVRQLRERHEALRNGTVLHLNDSELAAEPVDDANLTAGSGHEEVDGGVDEDEDEDENDWFGLR